jgi:deoxyinosine 3'endonuclease (endonuclease V)
LRVVTFAGNATYVPVEGGAEQVDELCGVDVAFKESGRYPRCASILLDRVFQRYMEDGVLPDEEGFIQ